MHAWVRVKVRVRARVRVRLGLGLGLRVRVKVRARVRVRVRVRVRARVRARVRVRVRPGDPRGPPFRGRTFAAAVRLRTSGASAEGRLRRLTDADAPIPGPRFRAPSPTWENISPYHMLCVCVYVCEEIQSQ
jgi:hypothetical protein